MDSSARRGVNAIRVALVGDHNPAVTAHRAIPRALELAAQDLDLPLSFEWFHTAELSARRDDLRSVHGMWCVPASPYADMQAALEAIRWARESGTPYLGTCGGFQHALLEFAHHVLKFPQLAHAEVDPESTQPLIAPLSCALVEKSGSIRLSPGSKIAGLYGAAEIVEEYHCSFGIAREQERLFHGSALEFVGRDASGEVRAFELSGHPFFVGTLFQPERAALRGTLPPLARGFAEACWARAGQPASI